MLKINILFSLFIITGFSLVMSVLCVCVCVLNQGCHLDPLLDDSITFARRLKLLGKRVHLELIPDVPHGFLNFVLVSSEAKAASSRCVEAIRQMLSIDSNAL